MTTPALSDHVLALRVSSARDRQAFDQLVRRHQSAVRRFLLGLTLGNEALSDDLAQDTFLKAYLHIGQYQGTAQFQTWLMRIAYNVFYDYRRSHGHEMMACSLESADMRLEDRSARAADCELKNDIYRALSLLRDEERTCITLQLIEGEPIDRIAEITGLGPNTVKSLLRRGKERLATYLKQNGYDR